MAELVIRVSALRLAHAKHTRGPKDTHLTLSKQPHDWSHITTVKQIIWFYARLYTFEPKGWLSYSNQLKST